MLIPFGSAGAIDKDMSGRFSVVGRRDARMPRCRCGSNVGSRATGCRDASRRRKPDFGVLSDVNGGCDVRTGARASDLPLALKFWAAAKAACGSAHKADALKCLAEFPQA